MAAAAESGAGARKNEEETGLRRSYEMNMCSGPLFSKILLFALPLMCSGILQLLFNAADIIVVGALYGQHGAGGRWAPLLR